MSTSIKLTGAEILAISKGIDLAILAFMDLQKAASLSKEECLELVKEVWLHSRLERKRLDSHQS